MAEEREARSQRRRDLIAKVAESAAASPAARVGLRHPDDVPVPETDEPLVDPRDSEEGPASATDSVDPRKAADDRTFQLWHFVAIVGALTMLIVFLWMRRHGR